MLKLYSAPRTRSIRVAWLLEEMNQDYEVVSSEFIPTSDEFFIQKTPTGKFPTIDDDGLVMFESGAITEYLLEKYGDGSLAPKPGDPKRGEFLQWMYFADATAFSPLGIVVWLSAYRDDAADHQQLILDASKRAKTGLVMLEKHMADKTWVLGDEFSAADIMIAFTLMAAKLMGIVEPDSVLDQYLDRLQARPSFRTAAEKTGNEAFVA